MSDTLYHELGLVGVTSTKPIVCDHANGWYHTINIKILFWTVKRRFFFCSDCGEAIQSSEVEG